MEPTLRCPNCGNPAFVGTPVCANCGAALPPAPPPAPLWPPPPTGQTPQAPYVPPGPKLVTGHTWADVLLGVGLTILAICIGGLGLIVMPIVYVLVRANFKAFGMAIGYTLLVSFVLVLGAFALCFYGMSKI